MSTATGVSARANSRIFLTLYRCTIIYFGIESTRGRRDFENCEAGILVWIGIDGLNFGGVGRVDDGRNIGTGER